MRMRSDIPWIVSGLAFVTACGGTAKPAKDPTEERSAAEAEKGSGFAAPGACVDPLSDGDHHDSMRPFDKHVQQDVHAADLDADGVIDAFVKPGWACGDSCTRSAYVVRGTCAHWVGSFASTERYEALDTMTNGLKDLSTRPRRMGDDGQIHCWNVVLKYDGKEYQPAKTRECECKDEGAKCAAWDE